jgi:hypothetical protein
MGQDANPAIRISVSLIIAFAVPVSHSSAGYIAGMGAAHILRVCFPRRPSITLYSKHLLGAYICKLTVSATPLTFIALQLSQALGLFASHPFGVSEWMYEL